MVALETPPQSRVPKFGDNFLQSTVAKPALSTLDGAHTSTLGALNTSRVVAEDALKVPAHARHTPRHGVCTTRDTRRHPTRVPSPDGLSTLKVPAYRHTTVCRPGHGQLCPPTSVTRRFGSRSTRTPSPDGLSAFKAPAHLWGARRTLDRTPVEVLRPSRPHGPHRTQACLERRCRCTDRGSSLFRARTRLSAQRPCPGLRGRWPLSQMLLLMAPEDWKSISLCQRCRASRSVICRPHVKSSFRSVCPRCQGS